MCVCVFVLSFIQFVDLLVGVGGWMCSILGGMLNLSHTCTHTVEPVRKFNILNGLDDIGLTLQKVVCARVRVCMFCKADA